MEYDLQNKIRAYEFMLVYNLNEGEEKVTFFFFLLFLINFIEG